MPIVDLTPRLARETGPVPKDAILFDRKLPGFTSTPWAAKSGSCWPAPRGRSRIAIARHGEMGLAHARRCARNLLAHIRNCDNPAEDIRKKRTAPTLRDLANEYLDHCDPHWKPSVRKTVRIYLKARILPGFCKLRVDRVGPEDVAACFDKTSKDRPGAAKLAYEIPRLMMFRAEEWGWREHRTIPCIGIRKNPRRHVARFLDTEELALLGRALDVRKAQWPEAVSAIRLLALTGHRRGEILNLRWRNIEDGASLYRTQRRARAASSLEKRRSPLSRRCPVPATPTPSCSRRTRGGGRLTISTPAGGWSAKTHSSAGCACSTCGTPLRATRSCRAKRFPRSASCASIGATAQQPETPTTPIPTSSKPPRRLEASSTRR